METTQERLDKELSKGKSIAMWAIGYYVEVGNQYCPSLKVPIFDRTEEKIVGSTKSTKVLIDYLGSMMWINVKMCNVYYGWGIYNSPSQEGKDLRRVLESLKTVTFVN
jgi:hypothetical protein